MSNAHSASYLTLRDLKNYAKKLPIKYTLGEAVDDTRLQYGALALKDLIELIEGRIYRFMGLWDKWMKEIAENHIRIVFWFDN